MKKYRATLILLAIFLNIWVPKSLHAETIITSTFIDDIQIWNLAGSPYIFQDSVGGDVTVAEGGVLNIEAGVVIRVYGGRKFNIHGTLNILGEEGNEVIMTNVSDAVSSHFNRWGGIVFHPGSVGNINFLEERYTGFVQFQPGGPAISNRGGIVEVKNSSFSENVQDILQSGGAMSINDSRLEGGLTGITQEGGDLALASSTVSNTEASLNIYNTADKFSATGNIFKHNIFNPIINVAADFNIIGNTLIGGNRNAWLLTGSVTEERTLFPFNDGEPVAIDSLTVRTGGKLTVSSGTILKGNGIIVEGGELDIQGTIEAPVILTTITDDFMGGDTNNDGLMMGKIYDDLIWTNGIQVNVGGKANVSNLTIRDAGGLQVIPGTFEQTRSALLNTGGEVVAKNLRITDSATLSGIHHYGGTTDIDGGVMDVAVHNYALIYDSGSLNVHNFSFFLSSNQNVYSLFNRNNLGVPDVRHNWWGTTEGPLHEIDNPGGTAPRIEGQALFKPFLTEPFNSSSSEQTINPVIIIPGIMGSAYKNGVLVIDPILHTYDDLVATLVANGYEEGKDLFTFPYEWRDSNVFTANLLDDKIEQVKSICQCDKVDIVAHSMGGLVTRSYIQSADYDEDVDQVIFLGTPHRGSVIDYIKWEAGQFVPEFFDTLAGLFFSAESVRNGYTSVFDYIRNRPISSIQELLPTFDYLKDQDTEVIRIYPSNYPRNLFLENLNNNISNLLDSGVEIINIAGNTGENTAEKIRVITSTKRDLWEHGEPDGFYIIPGDHGLENGAGDGTVTALGSTLNNLIPNYGSNASHRRLPTIEENKIFNILTGKVATTNIDNGFEISPVVLLLQLLSPIDVLVTVPDGRKIGKNFSTSAEYNEIPNAFYSGFQTDNEYITILNPQDGEYKVEVQGTSRGGKYGILTSYISDTFATTTQIDGITEMSQITTLNIDIDNNKPENISSEKMVTLEVLVNDIDGAYNLGWISDKKVRDGLIKKVQKIYKNSKNIDKNLVKVLKLDLKLYKKDKINEQAYNLIKTDLEWLINN
ncbi:MAG: hypothetical protein HYX23_01730 [Candidatus Zambryskibacteria bacterium]|nr:hypothetical protein [Candidatus Zambryskibacteria bacterium]